MYRLIDLSKLRLRVTGLLLGLALVSFLGCSPSTEKQTKPQPPAKVEKISPEDSFAMLKLTPEAVTRLGIRVVGVERRPVRRVRLVGGEVLTPPGAAVTLSAPLAATVLKPSAEEGTQPELATPTVGTSMSRGQRLFALKPILSPDSALTLDASRVEAEEAVKEASVRVEAARVGLDRAKQLLADGAGSRRGVDDAQAAFDVATAQERAAVARRDALLSWTGSEGAPAFTTGVEITSPIDGVLFRLLVAPGQVVASGEPLAEITNLERLWVRVPVYVGDLSEVDVAATVEIGDFGDVSGTEDQTATPVSAPPTANPSSATVDLYYEIARGDSTLRPGQKVRVCLPIREDEESLVVPWSSVLHDEVGGTWVYEQSAPGTYVRRRVLVRHVEDGLAALARGPEVGRPVVAEGAVELFGTEFGVGK